MVWEMERQGQYQINLQLMSRSLKGGPKHNYYQEQVENIVQGESLHYECICPKATRDLQVSQRTQTCYRCSRDYHTNCMWPLEDAPGEYECPLCFLRYCLPDRRVKQVLFGGYLRQTKKNKIQYRINLPLESDLLTNYSIEARCVRLNKECKYELTWPEHCVVHFNHKKIAEFKPLPASSSIKRRIDEEIPFERKVLAEENTLVIQERHQYMEGVRKDGNSHHFVVICAVVPLVVNQMMMEMQGRRLLVEHSKNRLREYLNRGFQDCFIEKIKVPLKCHFYSNKITIPVRSKHCRTHYEPFDLRGFILANINSKLSVQKWKCPLCKKRAYDLEVDQYLLKIINADPSLTEIYFNKLGELQLFGDRSTDKDQPSLTTSNTSADGYLQEEHRNEGRSPGSIPRETGIGIKKESTKPNSNQSNSCHEIAIEETEQKSKIVFQECIELDDDDLDEGQQAIKPKRSYRQRSSTTNFAEMVAKVPRKKHKIEHYKAPQVNPEPDSDSVRPLESREVEIYHSEEDEPNSHFSDEEFNSKPDKKKKAKRSYHRERVGVDEPIRNIEKMAKTLLPSPSISTVIPEAIRITEGKLPELKRVAAQHQAIEIPDQEEEGPELLRFSKLQYHLGQLQKEKESQLLEDEREEITASQETAFLALCEGFILSLHRS